MTAPIIYHDFRQDSSETGITQKALEKGNRILKIADNVNTKLNIACIFLCGVCTTLSVLALVIWAFCP